MKTLPLYTGRTLRLTPLNAEKDAPAASQWTIETDIAEKFREGPAMPLTSPEVRKVFEGWVKEAEDSGRTFVFAYRPQDDERLVGFLHIAHVEWVHGAGMINLVIGETQDRAAYAREALEMALNYAFDELNLFRVTIRAAENDRAACRLFDETNLTLEVRQRQAVYRDGRLWDRLSYGMLRPEWLVFHPAWQAFRPLEVA